MPQPAKPAPADPAHTVVDAAWAESAWKQLAARDPQARFFYAVATTGVFCRPTCSSRRPLRANVRFFRTAAEARGRRLSRLQALPSCDCVAPWALRAAALWTRFVRTSRGNLDRRVRLEELGRVARLSPFTVQRLFKREMGVSPLAIPARPARVATARRTQERRAP